MLIILIGIASSFSSLAQESDLFEKLGDYRKFSLMIGPTLYHSAESRITSGTMAPENLPIWGISGGFEVDIRPERQWSFVTGMIFAKEPSYHIRLNIKQEDIPSRTSDLIDKARDSYVPTLSLPLLITYKLPLSESQFLEFRTGGKVKIFPSADILYSLTYQDDMSGTRELFRLTMENTEKFYFGSFLFGAGITTLFNSFLIKTNLLYTLNFQDTYRGEYAFANLSVSGSSTGTYALSGNNVSLMFSIAFKKPENRIKDYY
ncbi:hypothetical protein G3O08_09960 [Cryomorpha ignava]|uniref:PorT family protein n=1 Tax=Cryomorpha ignava TaxID=101383 RepID=A0A7K3WT38_9FLAO|nr:hypothetical protein [Cryomorpha ignava]NEN23825.1 hypothetical protein [Cryomorpha ignava]